MSIFGSKSRITVCTLAGAALGYFLLHPYTMFVYSVYERTHEEQVDGGTAHVWFHLREALSTFEPGMLHMGIPYALIGGIAGLFFGLWLNARRHRVNAELNACAMDTMKTLVVTLSHYLLNAATVIGGFAWRIQKENPDSESLKHAMIIREEAENVEAIVKSLIELQAVQAESYTKNGEARIIDLTEDIKKRLKERAGGGTAGSGPDAEGEKQ